MSCWGHVTTYHGNRCQGNQWERVLRKSDHKFSSVVSKKSDHIAPFSSLLRLYTVTFPILCPQTGNFSSRYPKGGHISIGAIQCILRNQSAQFGMLHTSLHCCVSQIYCTFCVLWEGHVTRFHSNRCNGNNWAMSKAQFY